MLLTSCDYNFFMQCLCNGSIYPFRFQNLLRLDFMANALNWHVLQALLRNAPNLEVLDVINTVSLLMRCIFSRSSVKLTLMNNDILCMLSSEALFR